MKSQGKRLIEIAVGIVIVLCLSLGVFFATQSAKPGSGKSGAQQERTYEMVSSSYGDEIVLADVKVGTPPKGSATAPARVSLTAYDLDTGGPVEGMPQPAETAWVVPGKGGIHLTSSSSATTYLVFQNGKATWYGKQLGPSGCHDWTVVSHSQFLQDQKELKNGTADLRDAPACVY